ncbi:MAG: GTP cyclohydrolase FolE2 [Candidatus Cloacimonadaceae bacterium]|jgi:GTP cyclohydrolase I|nr:GTP cyclohydrolase FolE2 [Candidatus Cloacimonadota bacterium]MDY0126847.1 GTP cyclohydrolase FolE2 [Candidatus Cloacimonadaceae bacterium]MCB5255089.1 GTP cyclohydrolase FolE2 [Candidatus Cloacimonadota bacterium]MCK9177622.1 GTP cyclohydrolase FolE2 [Candidatus Cloacimonadota bacterium]MCK9242484.1 GTP cyclohydrolase FolE2 [Candidatus Cloacimonadota bacterium]
MKIPDLQSQNDTRNTMIDKVGIKGLRYPIVVEDRANEIQHTVADLNIYVELPHHMRGTHMSRFVEILHHYHQEALIGNLEPFLSELKTSLKAEAAYIDIAFPYFLTKKAPVSKIASILAYDCVFSASLKDEYELLIGVTVPVTTLCPCSKEISDAGAHNQRSKITIKVSYTGFVWLEELIELAEATASCEIYSLLKRVDEKYVTEKAYNNPKFVEDIVREITLRLQSDERITGFFVESENAESIHLHNAYAMISRPGK